MSVQVNCTPQLIFSADTQKFCKASSRFELILTCTYMAFAVVCCLTCLAVFDKLDFFGFFQVLVLFTRPLLLETSCWQCPCKAKHDACRACLGKALLTVWHIVKQLIMHVLHMLAALLTHG